VVDAEDLVLVEDREHLVVELLGLGEGRAERLLDDHAHVGALVAIELALAELADDDREERRRGREVEAAVHPLAGVVVELVQGAGERLVHARLVERAGDVADLLEQLLEHRLVGLAPRELLDRLLGHVAELLVGHLRARHANEVEALGQRALVREVVDRRQQLAVREVARGSEDDQRRGVDRQALEPLDEGVLGADGSGDSAHSSPLSRSVSSRTAAAGSSPLSVTRCAGRPWPRSVCRSPTACACLSRVKP
jgi:hypothetical protein